MAGAYSFSNATPERHSGLAMNAVAVRLALRIAAPGPVWRLMLAREGDAAPPKLNDHASRQWPSDATASLPRATLLLLTYIQFEKKKRNRVHMLEFFNLILRLARKEKV